MTPLERAARALVDNYPLDSGESPLSWQEVVPVIRAVLQAIREPSEAMIEEAYESYTADGGSLRDVFMNMIDAALEEG